MWGEANNMRWSWLGSPLLLKLVLLMVNQYWGNFSQAANEILRTSQLFRGMSEGEKGIWGPKNEGGLLTRRLDGVGEERLAMCSCCNALLQQTCPEQQWASWLACLFQRNACTGRLSPDCDSLQSLWWIDQGKKEDKKDRRGTPSAGGYKRCAWLTGPNHRPSSSAVTLHLFESQKIHNHVCAHAHTHETRVWVNDWKRKWDQYTKGWQTVQNAYTKYKSSWGLICKKVCATTW